MRVLAGPLLILALAALCAGRASAHGAPPVTLQVAVGYGGQYRDSSWTPIRVSLHNRTSRVLAGTVEVPDSGNASSSNPGPPAPFPTRYEAPLTLPPGATKTVTLYLPGVDLGGQVTVRFRVGDTMLATHTAYPSAFGQGDLVIGTLVTDPRNASWVHQLGRGGSTDIVRLSPTSLDPQTQALASFDVIVLTNVNAALLDASQLAALEGFVRSGGSLILVGGPDGPETLGPLPPALLPGRLAGSRTLATLSGLAHLASGDPPSLPAVLSVLSRPQGQVLASQQGLPLVVVHHLGQGRILYLAFDPALAPLAGWRKAVPLLTRLVGRTAPEAVDRWAEPPSYQQQPFSQYGPAENIGAELTNLPAAALPSLLLFLALSVLYVLLLGPVHFLVLRRLQRVELAWLTLPAGALGCLGLTFGLAFALKGESVLLNTISVVQLAGNGPEHPASRYVGLFAPVRGDYHLAAAGSALPSTVPQYQDYGPGPGGKTLGLRFQEGPETGVRFPSMTMWSMREVALSTQVRVPGGVQGKLWLDAKGEIVGEVHNGTDLTLVRPVIMAGRGVTHLGELHPGQTVRVRVRPHANVAEPSWEPNLLRAYGQPRFSVGNVPFFPGSGVNMNRASPVWYKGMVSTCCYGPNPPPEKTLADRIRNTADALAGSLDDPAEVTFAAWSQQPLGT